MATTTKRDLSEAISVAEAIAETFFGNENAFDALADELFEVVQMEMPEIEELGEDDINPYAEIEPTLVLKNCSKVLQNTLKQALLVEFIRVGIIDGPQEAE